MLTSLRIRPYISTDIVILATRMLFLSHTICNIWISLYTNAPAEKPTDYSAMSTEALCLTLGERHLQQTGNHRELIS